MKSVLKSSLVLAAVMLLAGCGGSSDSQKREEVKNSDYYLEAFRSRTSIDALHTDKTVLFSITSLSKTLKEGLADVNQSTIDEIVYAVHRRVEKEVKNINNFTFNADTPLILYKEAEGVPRAVDSKKHSVVNLITILDEAAQKITGTSLSGKLSPDFIATLDGKENVSNTQQPYIAMMPSMKQELLCPPSGLCSKRSRIVHWQKAPLVEMQKVRETYKKEVQRLLDGNSSNKALYTTGCSRKVKASKSWTCESDGYTIRAVNYVDGETAIDFTTRDKLAYKARSLISFRPFDIAESFQTIILPQNNIQQVECLTDGSWVASGDTFYHILKNNTKSWSGTSAHWEGSQQTSLLDIENAAQALQLFGSKLASMANGPLPSGCRDIACVHSSTADGPDLEWEDPMHRISMHTVAMSHPELSGQDIFQFFRGDVWGQHEADLEGLSLPFIATLDNLGIIDGQAIKQEILNRWRHGIDGRFLFKKLEIPKVPVIDFMPEDDSADQLIILPKPKNYNPEGAFPTNQYVRPIKRVVMPFGRLNPYYCAQNDPLNPAYIPQYLVDPKVMLELVTDVTYLTEEQLYRIEDEKNIAMWEQYDRVSEDENGTIKYPAGYGDAEFAPYPPRLKYNCHMTEPTKNTDAYLQCDTKDEAYYDALIDRLIVVNPILNGNVANHPCNQAASLPGASM